MSDHTNEDGDSIDDLDDTHTEDASSDILDVSKTTDADPDTVSVDTIHSSPRENTEVEPLSPTKKQPAVTSARDTTSPPTVGAKHPELCKSSEVHTVQSRFKVVKIESKVPYKRGRWTCVDGRDPPPEKSSSVERSDSVQRADGSKVQPKEDHESGNSSAASSVNYTHGVDDPSKNPLANMQTSSNYPIDSSQSGVNGNASQFNAADGPKDSRHDVTTNGTAAMPTSQQNILPPGDHQLGGGGLAPHIPASSQNAPPPTSSLSARPRGEGAATLDKHPPPQGASDNFVSQGGDQPYVPSDTNTAQQQYIPQQPQSIPAQPADFAPVQPSGQQQQPSQQSVTSSTNALAAAELSVPVAAAIAELKHPRSASDINRSVAATLSRTPLLEMVSSMHVSGSFVKIDGDDR